MDMIKELETAITEGAPTEQYMRDFCEAYLRDTTTLEHLAEVAKEQADKIIKGYQSQIATIQYMRGQTFKMYVEQLLRNMGGAKKSINFLAGTAGKRKGQPKIVINDEKKAIAWAKECCNEAVKETVAVSLSKDVLMSQFKTDGVIPDGCEFQEATDKFYPWFDKYQMEDTKEGE